MVKFKKMAIDHLNIVFIVLAFLTMVIVNNIKIDFTLFWEISLGLLAFVGLFYGIVYKKEFLANRDKLMKKLWKSNYLQVKKHLDQLSKILKGDDIKVILETTNNEIDEISSGIRVFSEEHQKIDFDYYMRDTVFFSFATIIVSVIAEFLSKPFYFFDTNLSLNSIEVALLFTTFYVTIKFVMACYKIGLVVEKNN